MVFNTKEEILKVARLMVQAQGYNALSFRNVATAVGVKSSSIHHYFPTKGDLGAALARQYTQGGAEFLEGLLSKHKDRKSRLKGYTYIFRAALENDNRMCLVGIMAAEHGDLPEEVRIEIARFNDTNIEWLARVLAADEPQLASKALQERALAIFSAIGGAQLLARGRNDISLYDTAIKELINSGLIA